MLQTGGTIIHPSLNFMFGVEIVFVKFVWWVRACLCVRLKKSLLITTTFVLLTSDVSERQTDHNKISIAVVTVSLMFLCGLRTHSRAHFYTQCIAITLMRSHLSAFCAALIWSPCNRSWPFSQSGECYDGAPLTFAQCSFSKAEMSPLARKPAGQALMRLRAHVCVVLEGGIPELSGWPA